MKYSSAKKNEIMNFASKVIVLVTIIQSEATLLKKTNAACSLTSEYPSTKSCENIFLNNCRNQESKMFHAGLGGARPIERGIIESK